MRASTTTIDFFFLHSLHHYVPLIYRRQEPAAERVRRTPVIITAVVAIATAGRDPLFYDGRAGAVAAGGFARDTRPPLTDGRTARAIPLPVDSDAVFRCARRRPPVTGCATRYVIY